MGKFLVGALASTETMNSGASKQITPEGTFIQATGHGEILKKDSGGKNT